MKKKLLISLAAAALIAVSAVAGAYAAAKMTLVVNGQVSKVEPKVINGTTYVPLRAAAEMLGASITYDPKSSVVTVTSNASGGSSSGSSGSAGSTGSAGTPAATSPGSGTTYKADDFVFKQLTIKENAIGMYDIHVDITNNGADAAGVLFSAVFYDGSGKRLGTAQGAAQDLTKGETNTVTLVTLDDLSGYKTFKFQIDGKY